MVLTSWFGINLLLSNVISLCALTVVRYAFADRVIWAPDVRLHHYDVHGLVTLTSPVALRELARFEVPELAEPARFRSSPAVSPMHRTAGSSPPPTDGT